MAPYTYNNNNYYDPVGSQPSQPQSYTCANTQQQQGVSSSSQYPSNSNASYQTGYTQSYNTTYGSQQYGSSTQQQANTGATRAAGALNSLSGQGYSQAASDNRTSNANGQFDNAYYGNAGFSAVADRSQSNESPLYASNSSASTFGRLSLPDQSPTSSNTFANTQTFQQSSSATNASTSRSYQNAPSSASRGLGSYENAYNAPQSQQQQPQRYASPLHAVQAQQGHSKQASRTSSHTASPQMTVRNAQQQRQQTASVEPSHATVNPSQVYDMRAEQQRKAQVDAEKRRKADAARKREEEARAAEAARQKAEDDRKAEAERSAREAEETAKKAEEEAKKKAANEKKNAQRRKAREEKRQSKTAATALTQMASSSSMDAMSAMMGDMSAPPANDDEAEMRAMFKKMREFNAKNPAMLAKLWEEERTQHAAQISPQAPKAAAPAQSPPKQKQAPKAAGKQPAAAIPPPAIPTNMTGSSNTAPTSATAQQPYKPKPTPATQAPPQPVVKPASTALWPPHKKGSLAEAAANWLNNLPENASFGRTIAKEEVLKILDTNPSYVQLCESIEKTHIRFERSALAKELLKAVPDGLKNNQNPASTTSSDAPMTGAGPQPGGAGTSSETSSVRKKGGRPKKDGPLSYGVPGQHRGTTGPVAYQSPAFASLADAAHEVNSMSTATHFPPGMGTVASALTGAPPPRNQPFAQAPSTIDNNKQPPEIKSEKPAQAPPPEEPRRPPADKEEAARKRNFGDLVDLTANDDSDDDGPPRKIQQVLSAPVNGAVKPPPANDSFRQPRLHSEFWRQPYGATNGQPAPNLHMNMASSGRPWVIKTAPVPPTPASIMPSQVPQASQPPPARPKGPSEEQKQHERMRGKMLVEPIMRDRVARKSKYDSRTIARDVLLATGRHPDMRALNSHLNPMQKLLGDHGGVIDGAGNKSDLSTIRWDVIDPGPTKLQAKDRLRAKRDEETISEGPADQEPSDEEPASRALANADFTEGSFRRAGQFSEERLQKLKEVAKPGEWERIGEDEIRRRLMNRWKSRQWRQRHVSQSREAANAFARPAEGSRITSLEHLAQDSDDEAPERGAKKKRGPGRPRTSHLASPSDNNTTRSTPAGSPAAQPSPGMSGGAVGYAAFRQVDEYGNVIKKKGRPVGWRKNIHSREAAGLTSKTNPTKTAVHRPRASQDFVKPSYQVFACDWQGCKAELDNLERLKLHVLKLHGAASDDNLFCCQWRHCRSAGIHVDADGNAKTAKDARATFDSQGHWMNHVKKAHIEPIAWRQGDGPKGGVASDHHSDSDRYLSDFRGRSVTPIIVPLAELTHEHHAGGADGPTLNPEMQMAKRLGRPPKTPLYNEDGSVMTKVERDAREELNRLRDQKLHEGITMGRESSRLANEKRRLGFLDDEDFEDIIEYSDSER